MAIQWGTMTAKPTIKKPSEKLRQAVYNIVGSFQKTVESIDRVFSIGRAEGFSDIEIGKMIRKEMSAAGYDPRTIRRSLPHTAKETQKTRRDYIDEDKMSSSEHKNDDHMPSIQELNNDSSLETGDSIRDNKFVTRVPDLSTVAREESEQHEPAEQTQHAKQDIGEENKQFSLFRISKIHENGELLKFEFSLPKDLFWQYLEEDDHLREEDDHFHINYVVNRESGGILSVTVGSSS